MPATTGHFSQSLRQSNSDSNVLVNETKRGAATPRISSAAKSIKCMPNLICIPERQSTPVRHWECLKYVQSEYTLTTSLSLQLGGMDISLDRTIVFQHYIFILFASLGLPGLVLPLVGIKGFLSSSTSWCPLNMVLATTITTIYCHLDCRVLPGRYASRAVTSRDFALLNDEDFLFAEHVHGKLVG